MRAFVACLTLAGVLYATGTQAAQAPQPPSDAAATLQLQIEQLRRDFDAIQQQYGARLQALESQLAALAPGAVSQPAAAAPAAGASATPVADAVKAASAATAPPDPGTAAAPAPVYGSAVSSGKVFNPDMAVIGDFLGAAGGQPERDAAPSLAMHESEASFQAVVDPYSRADFFVSFGEEGVNLEEGFITFTELPGGLLTRVGKIRAAFGKVNTLHNHVLTWADRPLVTQNLVGGEDGINDAGISVARLIPNPWIFLEATGQVFRGDSGDDFFKAGERGDLSYVGHLRGYQDLSESTNIDLGFSAARAHNASGVVDGLDAGRFTTKLFGVDATLRWRPLSRSIYRSFIGRAEMIWSRRDQPDGLQSSSGFYVSGDYQVGRRWFTGVRLDRSARAADATLTDSGASFIVTYWPSEFSQVRGQYRRTAYATGPTANEFLFQFQFSIGAHGAHPF